MKSKWIEYEGRKILFADYAGFGEDNENLQKEVDYITDICLQEPEKSILLLVDVRDSGGTNENVESMKRSALAVKPHVARTAVIGVNGYRRIFLKAVARFSGMELTPLDTLEEGRTWLVEK